VKAPSRAYLLCRDKGLMRHLEQMYAAEHLDEADAIKRPFLNCKVKLFDPMLISARHDEPPSNARRGTVS